METTLYRITFKDGREYRVFCANKHQKDRLLATRNKLNEIEAETIQIITNGIHNIKQWEEIINNEDNEK